MKIYLKQFLLGQPIQIFTLTCLALSPMTEAVTPAPDGDYNDGNTAEGEDALFFCDTSTGFAFGNTAVGYQACYNLVDNIGNTGIGSAALYNNEGNGKHGYR